MPVSSRAGGCTFAENPTRSCAQALPLWSAAVDPCALTATARPKSRGGIAFDVAVWADRACVRVDLAGRELAAITISGRSFRIDIVAGTLQRGPVALEFHLRAVPGIALQIDAMCAFLDVTGVATAPRRPLDRDRRLQHLIEALRVLDALRDGASLREIGAALLGGERIARYWPGDGDHLKSWVRRRVALARTLEHAGPGAILARSV